MNKFYAIFLELEKKIRTGYYLGGSLLPSENILAEHYEVSRETIRKALVLLLENGYIQKQQGKGSIVLNIPQFNFPVSGLTSYRELQMEQAIPSETRIIHNHLIDWPKGLKERMAPTDTEQVLYIERQRIVNNETIILDKDYFSPTIIPEISDQEAQNSIYNYLENTLGLAISYAKKEITVEPVTEEDQNLMDLHQDPFVVVVRSEVYLEDTRLFQHTESRHRIDKFKFVEFARRRHQL